MEQRHFLAGWHQTVKPSEAIQRAMLVAPCQQRHAAAAVSASTEEFKCERRVSAVKESRIGRGTDGLDDEDSGRHRQRSDGLTAAHRENGPRWRLPGTRKGQPDRQEVACAVS